MSRYLFLLSVSLFPAAALAQDPEPAGDSEAPVYEAAQPVITVTANGLGTAVANTGQAVTVIQREEIESLQGADVTRVLERTPGFSFSRNGGIGAVTSANIRGASSDQLLVLVDGVRVSDPALPGAGFDFGNLLTGPIGTIDLLRGSNSTIWGSGALGGVIEISSRGPQGIEGSLEYGSRDTRSATLAAGQDGDGYYVGLVGSWFETDGFSAAAAGTEPDGFRHRQLGARVFVDLTDQLELFGNAQWAEGDLDIDGFSFAPPYRPVDSRETQETRRHWGALGLAYYGTDLTLRATYARSDTERENRDPDFGQLFASDGLSQSLTLRGEYRLIGGLVVAFGGEREWLDYRTIYDDGAEVGVTGIYTQLGWVLGGLSVHAGARLDDHEVFGSKVSFGGDASYGIGGDVRLRASFGEGFKAPAPFQLYSDYGNRLLEPEESTSVEIGLERGARGAGTHLALTVFRRDTDDLIGFVSCFGVTAGICTDRPFGTFDNVDRARAQGIELEAGVDLLAGLRLSGVYSLIDTEDRMTGLDLVRRPRHLATIFADYVAPFGLAIGADLRLVGDSFDDGANAVRIEGYEVVTLRAALPLAGSVDLTARIENLFDADYETTAGYNTAGRGAFIGVRARM